MARRNATRPGSAPRSGRSLLDGFFARTGLKQRSREWRALFTWHQLAGPRLQRHVRAERVLGTAMLVRVATAPWANEISYLRAELLERLRADPGAAWITEVRFTVGPLDELPSWEDTPEMTRPPAPPAPLPPVVDSGPVAEALLEVTDPELREALGELFARASAAAAAAVTANERA